MSAEIEKIIDSLKKSREESLQWYMPLHGFLDEVIEAISGFSVDDYDFYEIFTENLVKENVLKNALPFLQADAVGGKATSIISTNPGGAKELDHSDMIPLYKKVISEWERRGFVNIKYADDKPFLPIDITISPRTNAST